MNYFQLLKKLYEIYGSLVGKEVDHKTILGKIRRVVRYPDCKIVAVRTLSVATNKFEVAGLYDPMADEEGQTPITVEIAFPKRMDTFYFGPGGLTLSHWSNFCVDFASILGHEFVHLNQFRRRNFNWCRRYKSYAIRPVLKERQEYYGDADELDAYAFMAAAEMAVESFRPTKKLAYPVEKTSLYRTYVHTFDKDDPVVLKFSLLANKYYKRLERQYDKTKFD